MPAQVTAMMTTAAAAEPRRRRHRRCLGLLVALLALLPGRALAIESVVILISDDLVVYDAAVQAFEDGIGHGRALLHSSGALANGLALLFTFFRYVLVEIHETSLGR